MHAPGFSVSHLPRYVHGVLAMILLLTLQACSVSSSTSTPTVAYPSSAESDPFYAQLADEASAPPGTLLDSRPVTFAPLLNLPLPNRAWQLRFASRDAKDRPIIAIATVVKRLLPTISEPALVSFQYAEDALGNQCAPSHTLTGSTANPISQAENSTPLPLLEAGVTLVYPDHEGPRSAYAAGPLAGRITLDAIRAALQFAPLGLSSDTPVGMWGYSGGAIATAWAAALQRRYAPELPISAVAIGGTPADLIGILKNGDQPGTTNSRYFSLLLSAAEGISREYPEFLLPILNARGKAAFAALADGCAGDTGDQSPNPSGHLADYTTVADPFASDGFRTVGPQISLPQEGLTPIADTLVYHSRMDELVPVAGADAMVRSWCEAGAPVRYYRGTLGGHTLFQITTAAQALLYLKARLSGIPIPELPLGTMNCRQFLD